MKLSVLIFIGLCLGIINLTLGYFGSDSVIQSIVDMVSPDSIRATIQRLQDFKTREPDTDSNRAAVQYARDRMLRYLCDTVYLHQFDTIYGYGPSVIGVKWGKLNPEIEYIRRR